MLSTAKQSGTGAEDKADTMDTSTCALEEILTCMLDFEPLKDPKVLKCGHTFCQVCLEKVYTFAQGHGTGETARQLLCPICCQPTLVPNGNIRELPDNITIAQLQNMGQAILQEMHVYQDKDKTVKCDSCLQSTRTGAALAAQVCPVRYFCYQCSEHYCQECHAKHKASFKDHKEVVDLQSNLKDMLKFFCGKHSKYMKFYCQNCSQALCTACRLHDHPKEHCIVDISDKDTIIQKRAELRKLKPVVNSNLVEANERSSILQGIRKQLFDAYAEMDTQLLSHFQKLRQRALKTLDDWYQQLENERVQRRKTFEKQLDITQEDLNFHVSGCQSLASFVDHLLEEDTTFQPLSLYSDLVARIQTLDRFMPCLDDLDTVPVAELVPNERCLEGITQPGQWEDCPQDVSYHEGRLVFTPSPMNRRSREIFFGEDGPPFFPPPGKVSSPAPFSLDEEIDPHHFDLSKLSISDLHHLQRSISENLLVDEQISDEEEFARESRLYVSDTKKRSRRMFTRRKKLKPKDRSWSAVDMQQEQSKGRDRSDSCSSQKSSSSFLKSIFRKSFGIGKKKDKEPKVTVAAAKHMPPVESPTKPTVDKYVLRWQRAGEMVRTASIMNKDRHTIRYLTGASYSVDDMWYVADNMAGKIVSYDAGTSSPKGVFTLGSSSFKPWDVAFMDLGLGHPAYLHCTDIDSRCVQVFSVNNCEQITTTEYSWGCGDVFNPCGICYNADWGKLVVSDPSPTGPTLLIADLNGTIVSRNTSIYGNAESQMKYPWYLTSDNLGRIYVSDRDNSAVKVFSMDGHFIGRFKHRIGQPAGITVDSMGYILVADRSGNHNIATFTPDGQFVGNLKTHDDISWPQALCCDSYGMVMVTEFLENSLTTLKCFMK